MIPPRLWLFIAYILLSSSCTCVEKTGFNIVNNDSGINSVIEDVITAIKEKKYESVKPLFTDNGYQMFNQLALFYTNVEVTSNSPKFNVYQLNGKYMCRHFRMVFHFENHKKNFVEDLIFRFNENKKIESISFGLSNKFIKHIIKNDNWCENDRLMIIAILEKYKTAYAFRELDYISSFFSNDELTNMRVKDSIIEKLRYNKILRYSKMASSRFIHDLKYIFLNQDYVNIQFEDLKISKCRKCRDKYFVQIKQVFNTPNYHSKSYIYLFINLYESTGSMIPLSIIQPITAGEGPFFKLEDYL
jgi:hypothetical protein